MLEQIFGRLPDGHTASLFTLENRQGVQVGITNYGGTVTRIWVPDRRQQFADITLGFDTLAPYLGAHPYFGAIIGRTAGRITAGKFTLEGKSYQLPLNSGPIHLHGGTLGFSRRLWAASAGSSTDGEYVRLTRISPDGEEGYPSTVSIAVTYLLTHANELRIEYEAAADGPTLINLTNHAYFNLSGESKGDIRDHQLQLFASRHASNRSDLTLDGGIVPTEAESTDFRQPARIGDRLPKLFLEHGALYFLDRARDGNLVPAARVVEPASGRTLEVLTTEPCVQFYTSSHMDGTVIGKSGRPYQKFSGLCLECQRYSDAINHPSCGNITLLPNEVYKQTTIYRFGCA